MESKDISFTNNFKYNKVSFNNDSTNQNFISCKIINIYNSQQNLTFERYKFQQNLPKKRVIMDSLIQEKKESFKEKDKSDSNSDYDKEEESAVDNIRYINQKDEIKNITNKSEEKINKKNVHFKSEEIEEKNNDREEVGENTKENNNLNKELLYNDKDININKSLNNSYISSFFYLTIKHLKEELEHAQFYYSNFNNSHNYLPKFNLKFNNKENNINSNGHNNNIIKNNESMQKGSLAFNISPNIFSLVYKQINIDKDPNEKNNKNFSNKKNEKEDKTYMVNNYIGNLNSRKNENKINIRVQSQKERKTNLDKESINNNQSFSSKNKFKNIDENQYNQTQIIFRNIIPYINNNIKFNNTNNNQKNEKNREYKFNNNAPKNNNIMNNNNCFYKSAEDFQRYKKFSNNINKQIPSNINKNSSKFNTYTIQNNLMIPQRNNGYFKINKTDRTNNKPINFKNINGHLNDSIQKNSNNINNTSSNITYKINYYNNNYINLINKFNKNQDSQNDELINSGQNEIEPPKNNILNNNQINNLKFDDFKIKMFGRFGWICSLCNNFNFDTRNKCNRWLAIKMPKTKREIFRGNKKNKKERKKRKLDWLCLNCLNINYSFRKNCNKCQIEKKGYFPLIY